MTPAADANPAAEGYYEKEGTVYRRSADKAVVSSKTYYARSTNPT